MSLYREEKFYIRDRVADLVKGGMDRKEAITKAYDEWYDRSWTRLPKVTLQVIPVGTRVVTHPFHHRGVVESNKNAYYRVRVDEDEGHFTSHISSSYVETDTEADYEIECAEDILERARYEVKDATAAVRYANSKLNTARLHRNKAAQNLRETKRKFKNA